MITELDNTAKMVLYDKAKDNTALVNSKRLVYHFVKRVFDIMLSFVCLFFLLPIALIIKILNMFNKDFDSIIYTQQRIGKDGKLFKFYKFRSMIPNADEELKKLLKSDKKLAQEYRINKKLENDPRITKVGKFIRKSSIDELPQLINIFKGDMSFVGNRPYLPREKKDMGNYYKDIVKTKPGLTGFWQCSLRSRGTFEDRLKMEKYYSNNYGFRFDISIFLKTFKVVLGRNGAK